MPSTPFQVSSFSQENFFKALECPSAVTEVQANPRATYLRDYLREIGARTIIVENDYVDGDYLDDYASFYVKCFEDYPKRCKRLHFFGAEISETDFRKAISDAESGATKLLSGSYLGFVVARPLPKAIIGRTVLKTYPSASGRRNYTCTKTYSASLFGIDLRVESLAYQEQDRALAACATVALWACFQKDRDLFQSLSPTPAMITRSANTVLEDARPFPSQGLKIQQVCNAIAAVGLEPEVVEAKPGIPLVSLIYGYLRLGAPVLLVVRIAGGGLHAITIAGFSLNPGPVLKSEGPDVGTGTPFIGLRIDEFYAHDDQVGPFSRLKVISPASSTDTVRFAGGWTAELIPQAVIVPLYTKIRLGYLEALRWLARLAELITVVSPAANLEWDLSLMTSNKFKAEVRAGRIQVPLEKRESLLTIGYPRYVWRGILRRGADPLLELLIDTTAMSQSFPICQLWWSDNLLRNTIKALFELKQVQGAINQLLTVRFAAFLKSTVD